MGELVPMRREGIRPTAASSPGAKRRADWPLAEGATEVTDPEELRELEELPALSWATFDPQSFPHRAFLAAAAGHDVDVRESRRRRWSASCSCGWSTTSRVLQQAAVEPAMQHTLSSARAVLELARSRGIELQPAAELLRAKAGRVSDSSIPREAG
jgi:hypothetical protein